MFIARSGVRELMQQVKTRSAFVRLVTRELPGGIGLPLAKP
jgi:hypothetical protein